MKKIIDGKLYNTETATLIGDWDNGCNYGDLDQCSESLYKTRKGQFFLAGTGGARSRYAHSYGNNSVKAGEGITLLNEVEAIKWCEQHDIDADDIAEHFYIQEG